MLATGVSLQKRITWLVLFFLLVGQIMLFSATGVLGLQRHDSEFYFVIRQGISAALGLGLLVLFSKVRYQAWGRIAYPLMAAQMLLVAATLFSGLGHHAQGATRWLRIGSFGFQPSEMAKVTVAIYVAHLLALRHQAPLSLKSWIGHGAPLLGLLFLIFRQPDLGTTALLVCMTLGLFFIAGARLAYIFGFLGGGAALLVFSMLHSDYRRRRLFAFLNPWADPQGSGFQTIQSFLSIHSGRLFGVGLGNGNSKLFYLPEVHTDFIFSLVGEELGFVGAIFLLLLFIYFAYLLFRVSFQAKDPFACYLAFGLSLALALQIAVNLGGVTGVVPVKGLTLPFISWGRSALLVNLAMVGILLNIIKQSAIIEKPSIKVTG